jgi:cytochrome c oxidase cbb3-type subunit 1
MAQAVIDWWFSNNLIFVWLALVGIGTAFYLLPKLSGRPLHSHYLALFAFWTLILFGSWCGIPQGAPVPAWLPTASSVAAVLTLVPLLVIAIIAWKTVCGANVACKGGPLCYVKFGTAAFILSGVMLIGAACPRFSRVVEFTWFGPAQTQLQILGFFAIVMCGAIYELLPRVMNFELPFPKFVRIQHWLFMLGVLLWFGSLAVGGVAQGMKPHDPSVAFADSTGAALMALRVGTTGLLLILLGALLFAANIFAMTFKWKLALLKSGYAAIKAPLETETVSLQQDKGEVKA